MVTIDGTEISGVTIDGQEVQEITMDGDVVWTASQLIDAFEDGNITEYNYDDDGSGDANPFSVVSTNPLEGTYSLDSDPHYGSRFLISQSGLNYYPSRGDDFAYLTEFQNDSYMFCLFGCQNSTNGNEYRALVNKRDGELRVEYRSSGSLVSSQTSTYTFVENQPYDVEVNWGASDITVTVYEYDISTQSRSSTALVSATLTDSTYDTGGFGWGTGGNGNSVDVHMDYARTI